MDVEISNGLNREGVWRHVLGVVTPGGDPCYACPFCGEDNHCYGVEHEHNYHHMCSNCGAKLKYPWEVKE